MDIIIPRYTKRKTIKIVTGGTTITVLAAIIIAILNFPVLEPVESELIQKAVAELSNKVDNHMTKEAHPIALERLSNINENLDEIKEEQKKQHDLLLQILWKLSSN